MKGHPKTLDLRPEQAWNKFQTYELPNGGEFDGDESHGIPIRKKII